MNRKDFLKNMATLGLASPFITTLLSSCNKSTIFSEDLKISSEEKVIIIGAGAAGLTAGQILQHYNVDFEILEASASFGGRVKKSSDFAQFPIDLGGEWIHTDPSVLADILVDPSSNAKEEIIVYNPQTYAVWKNGSLKSRNIASNFYSEHKFKSSTWFDFFADNIVPAIEDKISYNTPVNAIDYSGDKVQISTADGTTYVADKVIVTVPLKILQNEYINFNPSLPAEKKAAIDAVEMPDGLKVFLKFSERFYPDILSVGGLLSTLLNADHTYYNASFGKDSDDNILGLFTVGERASEYINQGSDEAILARVMEELDEIFEGKASQYYQGHVIQNWSAEPFIQGSYSYHFDLETIQAMTAPIENKVFFAGEAMNTNENTSTVHGAAESAFLTINEMFNR